MKGSAHRMKACWLGDFHLGLAGRVFLAPPDPFLIDGFETYIIGFLTSFDFSSKLGTGSR